MDVDIATEPRGEQASKPLLQTRIWKSMSTASRKRLQSLSVQYGINKKKDRRRKGVSLSMLAMNDQYPGFDVESGSAFMSDLLDAYSELATHCSTFAPVLAEAKGMREHLAAANADVQLLAVCDRIIQKLDVHAACPVLAEADYAADTGDYPFPPFSRGALTQSCIFVDVCMTSPARLAAGVNMKVA
jgi:hypothetical protein